MTSAHTTISIPKSTKERASKVAKKYDMTVSAVAKMLLNDFSAGKIQIQSFSVYSVSEPKITTDLNTEENVDDFFDSLSDNENRELDKLLEEGMNSGVTNLKSVDELISMAKKKYNR